MSGPEITPAERSRYRRCAAFEREISDELARMKAAIDAGDVSMSSRQHFLEYAAMLREWADRIAAFDPDVEEQR